MTSSDLEAPHEQAFDSIVVALDPSGASDRAIAVAEDLARLGDRPIELVSVCPPRLPEIVAALHLEGLIADRQLGDATASILRGEDAAEALAAHLGERRDQLVVMATSAHGYIRQRTIGSVTQRLLGSSRQPVLLVGPSVPIAYELVDPSLIVCVDGTDDMDVTVPVVTQWVRTFGGEPPRLAEVSPISSGTYAAAADAALGAVLRTWSDELSARGVGSTSRILHGGDPPFWLEEFAATHDAILTVTSARWTDEHGHPHSTARGVAERSTRPVLLIPADRSA